MRRPEPCAVLAPRVGGRPGPRRQVRPRVEALEVRSLLSVDGGIIGAWAPSTPIDPASTVMVRFDAGAGQAQAQSALDAVGGRVVTAYQDGPSVVALAPWSDVDAALAVLRADAGVSYAEPDSIIRAAAEVVPNDPRYSGQWGPAMVDAPRAWSISTGSASTIVAVLDSGLDTSSGEFAGRLWVNAAASTARRTIYGWNFVNDNGNIQDTYGHGTHVTGILAAKGNNGTGVAGLNWDTRIMPLKVLDGSGNGSTDRAVDAIYFAANNGARVINASWGGDVWNASMRDALNYANGKGVVFVTAAGNDGSNNDVTTTYPASYRTANELVVAAVDRFGNLASYSNYGATTVDLAAPGTDVLSTVPGGYANYTGTSMATPFVSATVALLAARYPSMSAAQLVDRVKATVKPMPGLVGRTITGGVVDAYHALLGTTDGGPPTTGNPIGPTASLSDVELTLLASLPFDAATGGTPESFVQRLFPALVGRAADASTLSVYADWLRGGMTRETLVRLIQGTAEARRTRVIRWYDELLGWDLDPNQAKSLPGIVFWADALASGQTDGQVLGAILGASGGTDAAFIDRMSQSLLGYGAPADVTAYYGQLLAQGTTRAELARAYLGLEAARVRMVARLYQDALGSTLSLDQLAADPTVVTLGRSMDLG